MNSFNKLYNIILESIIIEDKAALISRLKKAGYWDAVSLGNQLSRMNNNKLAEFVCSLFCNYQINSLTDPRLAKVIKVLLNDKTINLQKYVNNLDQFVKDYEEQYNTIINKQLMKDNSYLDSIPEFYSKQVYPNNVVVYKVRDSKAGLEAVRKVVDDMWGKDANPWCLITRNRSGKLTNAWSYWTHYNRFPKQIAFQNGKLLAFRASSTAIDYWWDRNDIKSARLKPLEGKSINVPPTLWSEEERKQMKNDAIAAFKQQFVYNLLTGRWDTKDKDVDIRIDDLLLINGDLPFPLGTIYGNIGFIDLKGLTSVLNGPTKVTGNIYYDKHSANIVINSLMWKLYKNQLSLRFVERFDLVYNPETKRYDANKNVWVDAEFIKDYQLPIPFGVINGNFDIGYCKRLKYVDYLPTKVTGSFTYPEDTRIGNMILKTEFYKNYINLAPERFIKKKGLTYNKETGMYDCEYALQIDPWDIPRSDIPVKLGKVKGFLRIERCSYIINLLNCPEEVGGDVIIKWCGDLKSLKGFPKHVGGNVQLKDIPVTTLEGMLNTIIEGNLDIKDLAYLNARNGCSFEKCFPKLKGNLIIHSGQYRDFKLFIEKNKIPFGV